MVPVEMAIGTKTVLNVAMSTEEKSLTEVVVTATQKKRKHNL
jgi:hypothetical protein